MDSSEILKTLSPLSPIPTGIEEKLTLPQDDIKAILFDIYGTLLISGSGDVGTASKASTRPSKEDMQTLFEISNIPVKWEEINPSLQERLESHIRRSHQESKKNGADYPEVEIRHIWKQVLEDLPGSNTLMPSESVVEDFAFRYELKMNPVWPMPGFPEIIRKLADSSLRIGIVSNAQFYTKTLLEVLTGQRLEEMGFEPQLCSFSYTIGKAKPSIDIFLSPLAVLKKSDIHPKKILYVGNDMLNDISSAASLGCRNCLFAGDRRSLRLREGDSRVKVQADMVIKDLFRLECLL